jgi:hypothetical protein
MQRYVPSGIVPFSGGLLCLGGGVFFAAISALMYALFINGVSVRYGHFVATLIFALALGFAVLLFADLGKVRSPLFVRFTWLVTFGAGYYFYWVCSVWMQQGWGVGFAAFDPQVIYRFGEHLFQVGSWGFGQWKATGWVLVAFWVVELLTIVWLSYIAAVANIDQPFCEHCNVWTETKKGLALFHATGSEPEWDNLRQGDIRAIGRVPLLASKVDHYVRLDVNACPRCERSNFLLLHSVKVEWDKEGENKTTTEKTFITNLSVTADQMAQLRETLDLSLAEEAEHLDEIIDAEMDSNE